MMKRREAHLTYRPPSKKASFAWLLVCAVGAALFAVMIAAQGALAHANHDPNAGWFQRCALAKTGTFDPIVFPNNPGPVGHEHLFFGATAISHDSTVSSLRAGGTTCRFNDGTTGGNNSSYWVPDLLLRDGKTWASGKQLNAYYKKGASSVDAHVIKPFPEGLKMIARDRNSSQTQVKWYCANLNGEGNNGKFAERPYDCNPTGTYPYVTARINFPQCGNGDTDTTDPKKYPVNDHISHMVYAGASGCPSTHPQVFPRLFITAKYNTSRGAGALLAGENSDPATGFHADYFEGWQPGQLKFYVDGCIRAGINCRSRSTPG
jgi:hypothetical protein